MARSLIWTAPLLLIALGCSTKPEAAVPANQGQAQAGSAVNMAGSNATGAAGTPEAKPPVTVAGSAPVPMNSTPMTNASGGMPGTNPAAGTGVAAAGGGGTNAADPTSAACRGFDFEKLIYSPGGSVLPNKCLPFHPTTNNPYAVRCVDVWPWYKTKFKGDQFCILPPPPDKGIQYGVHPQGQKWFEQVSKGDMSGYEGVSDAWIMADGEEEQANYQTTATNATMNNYYRAYARMRQGSHHMIVSSQSLQQPESWGPATSTGLGALQLPGAQRPDENAPKSLDKPAEDKGLFNRLPANAPVIFNMHHFNATGSPILKEAWTNLWWEEDATIEVRGILGLDLGQTATLAIPPGTTQDLHYSWNISQPTRLVTVFGHRHAWTSNFSSWVEEPGGKLDIIYQSFQWLDEPTYRYDSATQNPVPAPEARSDGATSGIRMLMPGQKLHFNCHIEYTDERAKSEGAPRPAEIGTLHFANEAFTAEMCILFGSTAGVQMATPQVESTKLPDFATID
jgi:hypothetical protein